MQAPIDRPGIEFRRPVTHPPTTDDGSRQACAASPCYTCDCTTVAATALRARPGCDAERDIPPPPARSACHQAASGRDLFTSRSYGIARGGMHVVVGIRAVQAAVDVRDGGTERARPCANVCNVRIFLFGWRRGRRERRQHHKHRRETRAWNNGPPPSHRRSSIAEPSSRTSTCLSVRCWQPREPQGPRRRPVGAFL